MAIEGRVKPTNYGGKDQDSRTMVEDGEFLETNISFLIPTILY